jgi:hypothetical protein
VHQRPENRRDLQAAFSSTARPSAPAARPQPSLTTVSSTPTPIPVFISSLYDVTHHTSPLPTLQGNV